MERFFVISSAKEEKSSSFQIAQDRVKTFLSFASEMNFPLFEVDDLESVGNSSSCKRIVDCLLSFKHYYEQNYDNVNVNDPLGLLNSSCQQAFSDENAIKLNKCSEKETPKMHSQNRKRWVIPCHGNANALFASNSSCNMDQKSSSLSFGLEEHFGLEDISSMAEQPGRGPSLHEIELIKKKIGDMLGSNARPERYSSLAKRLENISIQSLSSFATSIFGNKQYEEVSALVEFLLRKVLEEIERCFNSQSQQVGKLKSMLKEQLKRQHKLASRATLLETLAAGAGEEFKILSSHLQQLKVDHKKAEDEKKKKEAMIESLQNEGKRLEILIEKLGQELDQVRKLDQKHIKELEHEKMQLEKILTAEILDREARVKKANKAVEELEGVLAQEMEARKGKFEQYGCFILQHLQSLWGLREVLNAMRQEIVFLETACQEDLMTLGEELFGMVHAAVGYHKVLAENRVLYNEVQDLKGNIRVYCRVIPFLPGQSTKHSTVEFVGENGDILISNPLKQQGKETRRVFTFNKAFKASTTQEEVFRETQPLIRSVLDGFNVCIFAYGQTGSGKTYTMSGPNSSSEKDWGVNSRAVHDLFQISRSRKDVISYEVGVQMIEIYNEQVRDLLFIDASSRRLEIRKSSQLNGVNVPDACMLPVNSTSDVFHLMKIGQKNRAVGATALNDRSSRSHSVLTVHVRGTELASGAVLHGCLHLVDLAGSERVDRSEATGDRLKEAQHINRSLSALGDVVSALAQKSSHVPYRNSKLTQLLQDSLGGQAKTLMFVHISPEVTSYGETISTLKFAERVASVELGAAKSHKESRELRDLKEQVALLKDVVSKKELEIDRLNVAKVKWGQDKPKARAVSGHLMQDSYSDMLDQRLRMQTLNSRIFLEKPFENQQDEDFQSALLTAPSKLLTSVDRRMGTLTISPSEAGACIKQTMHEGNFGQKCEPSKEGCTEQPVYGPLAKYPQYMMEKDSYPQAMLLNEFMQDKFSDNISIKETQHVETVTSQKGPFIPSFQERISKNVREEEQN